MARKIWKLAFFGNPNRTALVPAGAQIGADLYMPDGTVATLTVLAKAIAALIPASSSGGGSGGGGGGVLPYTLWQNVLEKPANIIEVAELATSGIVVRQADGDWLTRTIGGTASRITVANGDGDAGAPTIDLAAVVGSAGGTLLCITVDAYGRVVQTRLAGLGDLDDVMISSGEPVDGDVLTYDGDISQWIPAAASGGGGGGYPPQLGYAGVI